MDINSAKALKRRLGPKETDEAPPLRADVDVAEDAPPVYRWLGVRRPATDAPREVEDDPATRDSMFRRVMLNLRQNVALRRFVAG